MTSYDVNVTRDGRWWMIHVLELDILTQARRLSEVSQMARELIAVETDAKLSAVSVSLHFNDIAGVPAADCLKVIEEERSQVEELKRDVASRTSRLAKDLVKVGVPLRDVGELLGVSYQRIHQIVAA